MIDTTQLCAVVRGGLWRFDVSEVMMQSLLAILLSARLVLVENLEACNSCGSDVLDTSVQPDATVRAQAGLPLSFSAPSVQPEHPGQQVVFNNQRSHV
jgi:hypothetical protein